METFVGVLATAVIGGVFAFATKYMADVKADRDWYRDKLTPLLEKEAELLEKIWEEVRRHE